MVENILHADPPPPLPRGQKVKFNFFRTLSICILNLKGNTNAANMVANIFPQTPPLHYGMGSIDKTSTFQNMVKLHITLKGITKFCCSPHHTPEPGAGIKRSKFHYVRTMSCSISKIVSEYD